ncbi:TIGR02678 family protein [Streptomyces sp. NPDC050516]|uniref:TIGR02678 family protein n=1 Tax=Streptomyces sp. NPDC050516 TaxID=3365621 RepID=UPI0037907BDF
MNTPLAQVLEGQHAADLRKAARALLAEPLLLARGAHADAFRLVRQHATELRGFDRNTGWSLQVDAETARLRKTPGTLTDPIHPAREAKRSAAPFTRRRYVLLCLALAALERGEAQIALGRLAEQVALDAADPPLAACGIEFTLDRRDERLDLAAVVRLLLSLGVLRRVAGDGGDVDREFAEFDGLHLGRDALVGEVLDGGLRQAVGQQAGRGGVAQSGGDGDQTQRALGGFAFLG